MVCLQLTFYILEGSSIESLSYTWSSSIESIIALKRALKHWKNIQCFWTHLFWTRLFYILERFKHWIYTCIEASIEALKNIQCFWTRLSVLSVTSLFGKLLSQYLKLNLILMIQVLFCLFLFVDGLSIFLFCCQFVEKIRRRINLAFYNPNSHHCSTLRYMIFTRLKAIKTMLFVKCWVLVWLLLLCRNFSSR